MLLAGFTENVAAVGPPVELGPGGFHFFNPLSPPPGEFVTGAGELREIMPNLGEEKNKEFVTE
jgi:hypothetical protein